MEVGFKFDYNSYSFLDKITGSPCTSQILTAKLILLNILRQTKKMFLIRGEKTSGKFGVRTNYLEKAYYEKSVN